MGWGGNACRRGKEGAHGRARLASPPATKKRRKQTSNPLSSHPHTTTPHTYTQDPEGILAAPQGGHIARRSMDRAIAENKELAEQVEKERVKAREELLAARESRAPPTAGGRALVDYFLDTDADEMEFEIARCRPLVDTAFLQFLDSEIGGLRFATTPNEDALAELEMLRDVLKDGIAAVDANAAALKAPAERLRKLLTAPDKKAALLAMAEANELDAPLITLLQQNVDAAKAAGNVDAVAFLEKVRDAARKFVITV